MELQTAATKEAIKWSRTKELQRGIANLGCKKELEKGVGNRNCKMELPNAVAKGRPRGPERKQKMQKITYFEAPPLDCFRLLCYGDVNFSLFLMEAWVQTP